MSSVERQRPPDRRGEGDTGEVIELPGREAEPEPLRPPRLTFAGSCLWCGDRGCSSSDCRQLHEKSQWDVCSWCDGTGEAFKSGQHRGCDCAYGLVLVAPQIQRRREVVPGINVVDKGHWSTGWHNIKQRNRAQDSRYTVVSEETLQWVDETAPIKERDIRGGAARGRTPDRRVGR